MITLKEAYNIVMRKMPGYHLVTAITEYEDSYKMNIYEKDREIGYYTALSARPTAWVNKATGELKISNIEDDGLSGLFQRPCVHHTEEELAKLGIKIHKKANS